MSRIVGYAGFVPGKQHVFGEKFGASAAESLRERADANTANSYLQKHEQRTSSKLDLTNVPSSNHLPGYAGHIPGLDAGNAKTFGTSTTSALQKSAEQIKGFAGESREMLKSMVPREMGLPSKRDWVRNNSAPAMEPRVPGYKGYLPGRQHIYGRTYGMASSALGAEHMRNSEDKNAFLGFGDSRPSGKDVITMKTQTNHVPGYAGHIPGLDAGSGSSFGPATLPDLITSASKISGGLDGPMAKIAVSSIPRDKAAARPAVIDPPARGAAPGSPQYKVESCVPGYTGFHPGQQHLYAETYGRATGALRQAHAQNQEDKNQFLGFHEDRVSNKAPITMADHASHVPGYGGHCPTTRDAIGKRFGVSTSGPLVEQSKDSTWFMGTLAGSVNKKDLPTEMGAKHDTGGAFSVPNLKHQLPGYTGFVPHSKDTFAKTYGQTTRLLDHANSSVTLATNVPKQFPKWALAGNNDGLNHLPGYAGHVPGYRDREVGNTFGLTTRSSIFTETDKKEKCNSNFVPASMYHSGLRMSEQKKKLVKSAVSTGTSQWNNELTTTGQFFSRGMYMA